MRHPIILVLLAGCSFALSGCMGRDKAEVDKALDSVNAVDATNLSDIMLTVGDPREAVAYFTRATNEHPERIDLQRGLGKSMVRAGQAEAAIGVWTRVIAMPEGGNDDRVALADAQIRAGKWEAAKATLNAIPPTHETFERYKLEAMVADSEKNWKKADSFYETAAGLTTRPSGVMKRAWKTCHSARSASVAMPCGGAGLLRQPRRARGRSRPPWWRAPAARTAAATTCSTHSSRAAGTDCAAGRAARSRRAGRP